MVLNVATPSLVLARKPYTLKRTNQAPVSTLEEDDPGMADPSFTNEMSAELHDSSMSSRQVAIYQIHAILQVILDLVKAIFGQRSNNPYLDNSLKGTMNDCEMTDEG